MIFAICNVNKVALLFTATPDSERIACYYYVIVKVRTIVLRLRTIVLRVCYVMLGYVMLCIKVMLELYYIRTTRPT